MKKFDSIIMYIGHCVGVKEINISSFKNWSKAP